MSAHAAPPPLVRDSNSADAEAITTIYNHYVRHTLVTFEEEDVRPAVMAERMASVHQAGLPWFVATAAEDVIGYAYATPWKPRFGYRFSVEVSVYVHNNQVGRGIGTQLYGVLIPELARRGFRTAVGGIALPNDASVRLHERLGFTKVGEFREIGTKFGAWTNVGYWQKLFAQA